jgi:hypothetical protein
VSSNGDTPEEDRKDAEWAAIADPLFAANDAADMQEAFDEQANLFRLWGLPAEADRRRLLLTANGRSEPNRVAVGVGVRPFVLPPREVLRVGHFGTCCPPLCREFVGVIDV